MSILVCGDSTRVLRTFPAAGWVIRHASATTGEGEEHIRCRWLGYSGMHLLPQVKAKIKEPEFEVPAGASPAHAKALRKKARLAAKKDALQVWSPDSTCAGPLTPAIRLWPAFAVQHATIRRALHGPFERC